MRRRHGGVGAVDDRDSHPVHNLRPDDPSGPRRRDRASPGSRRHPRRMHLPGGGSVWSRTQLGYRDLRKARDGQAQRRDRQRDRGRVGLGADDRAEQDRVRQGQREKARHAEPELLPARTKAAEHEASGGPRNACESRGQHPNVMSTRLGRGNCDDSPGLAPCVQALLPGRPPRTGGGDTSISPSRCQAKVRAMFESGRESSQSPCITYSLVVARLREPSSRASARAPRQAELPPSRWRSSIRRILPVSVLGRSGTNSISRG